MKSEKLWLSLFFLLCILFLVGCAQQESEIQPAIPEEMVGDHDQAVQVPKTEIQEPVVEEKDDLAFNLPPDEDDSAGWTQTLGPLGGTVIRMIPHAGTIWASLYSGGIYELQTDSSWKQIAVGYGIPEVRAFDIVTDSK